LGEPSASLTERGKGNIMLLKNKNLTNNAKALRKNMTRHEKRLWYDFLRKYPVKIYKQKIIGNYIVDFYCHSANLVIELDGSQHYSEQGENADEKRDKFMNESGLKVLRFSNLDIDRNFTGVCMLIEENIKERMKNDKL